MKKQFYKKGFTIVEALVAISILLLSITGAFAVAQSSLQSSIYAKNRVTAFYLAQEGIELVRNHRDGTGLMALKYKSNDYEWLQGLATEAEDEETGETIGVEAPCVPGGYACKVDVGLQFQLILYPEDFIQGVHDWQQCVGDGCGILYYDFTSYGKLFQYNDTNSQDGQFERLIYLDPVQTNDNEMKIRVEMRWNQGIVPKELKVEDRIFNWQDPNI